MESRACYGYYGLAGGATGENPPKTHKRGWHFETYHFVTDWNQSKVIEIKACDYEHAVKQAQAWAKRDGFHILGDA